MSSPTRSITVLYFAAAFTAVGTDQETIALPGPVATSESESGIEGFPLCSLPDLLCARHPDAKLEKVLKGSRWSVNEEMVTEEEESTVRLKGGEVVAVICPVSGG
ncbi:hypothetical protein SCHPADRAFT_907763 [Schizopora paradoxa]|uniref:Molybdopterin synthase sulfur carrier subunit n=1 Tax=Schizopora paradoxa TaxID=27342 RepID=A0A0H2RD49_9AGAM|nr:hypothetical protein SCHPADRAFT_907763 [Schizopora paradoxa]